VTGTTCPRCGGFWTIVLNPGTPHRRWHDDELCCRCRDQLEVEVTAELAELAEAAAAAAGQDLYASLSALLTPQGANMSASPDAGKPAFREPIREPSGYGTYPAARSCPKCGSEWTLLVDRPARQGLRSAVCGSCRTEAAHRMVALDLPVGDLPGPWAADALCAQTDPEIFHPEKGGNTRQAKAICQRCPVLVECRDWALETRQTMGIWGGLSWNERKTLLQDQRAVS
jgi:WhiB family transcriptional regulator, redox-sensing transcriptional regulator